MDLSPFWHPESIIDSHKSHRYIPETVREEMQFKVQMLGNAVSLRYSPLGVDRSVLHFESQPKLPSCLPLGSAAATITERMPLSSAPHRSSGRPSRSERRGSARSCDRIAHIMHGQRAGPLPLGPSARKTTFGDRARSMHLEYSRAKLLAPAPMQRPDCSPGRTAGARLSPSRGRAELKGALLAASPEPVTPRAAIPPHLFPLPGSGTEQPPQWTHLP